jgi:hypothetical protein
MMNSLSEADRLVAVPPLVDVLLTANVVVADVSLAFADVVVDVSVAFGAILFVSVSGFAQPNSSRTTAMAL